MEKRVLEPFCLRRKEMQLRSDFFSPLALHYGRDVLTKKSSMLNRCIENRGGFEFASRNMDEIG